MVISRNKNIFKNVGEIVNNFHVQARNEIVLLLWVLATHGGLLFLGEQECRAAGGM